MRSARAMASARSWVTSNAAVGRARQMFSSSFAAARGHRRVERDERFVQQHELRLDREGAGDRHAPRHAKRQRTTGTRRGMAPDRACAAARRQAAGLRSAGPASRFCARCARAAGAAPETPCRCAASSAPRQSSVPAKSVSRPPIIRRIVVLPQPDGPTSATISRPPSARSIAPSTGSSPRLVLKDLLSMCSRRITSAIASPSVPEAAARPIRSPARPG